MSKALISILGTNDYLNCRYKSSDGKIGNMVKYIQEDLSERFANDWSSDDQIRIFLTEEAKHKNWEDDGHKNIKNEGLYTRFKNLKLNAEIIPVEIPIGSTESEIWEIFKNIYDSFKEGEEVIIDVTHSFRSIPMFMIVLLNYAKLLKHIKVVGIYYGAFENLGPIPDVRNIPENERIAPIFDLTSFINLQEWTLATYNFLRNGITTDLMQITQSEISFIVRYTKETGGEWMKELKYFVKHFHTIANNILFCRGNDLIDYKYDELRKVSEKIKSHIEEIGIKPIIPLIDKIIEKVSVFKANDLLNGFSAVEWCIEHNLIQQGITILEETIISLVAKESNKNINDKEIRTFAASALNIKGTNIPQEEWRGIATDKMDEFRKILDMEIITDIAGDYAKLSDLRNDINHAGFRPAKRNVLCIKASFKNVYESIKIKLINRGIL